MVEKTPSAPIHGENEIKISSTTISLRPASEIPPRQWLYGRHLIRGFLSLTVAPGGVGKSSMVLVEALAMVPGRPLLGDAPPEPLRVWVWNSEDPREEIERRISAACLQYNIQSEDIADRLMIESGRDVPIQLATANGADVQVAEPVTEDLIAAIQTCKVDVLVIDPFVTSHLVPENDTTAMNAVVAQSGAARLSSIRNSFMSCKLGLRRYRNAIAATYQSLVDVRAPMQTR